MNRDWATNPVYESDALRVETTALPLILSVYKRPREVTEQEVQMMMALGSGRLATGEPYLSLVLLRTGHGLIAARQRKLFADWLDDNREALRRANVCTVIVIPAAIFRAALRVVYRFRVPPLRTLTVPSVQSAVERVEQELQRMGVPKTPVMEALLQGLLTSEAEAPEPA